MDPVARLAATQAPGRGPVRSLVLMPLLASVTAGAPARTAPPSPEAAAFETVVKPFLARNCYLCHGARLKNADVDLQAFETAASVVRDPPTWEKAVMKMRTGQMPPPPLGRPDEAEIAAITGWIENELERADRLAGPDPGRVTVRRLNRTEYNNTVRDLLGVTLRPADDFPQDDAGYGFDNIADVLSLSPVLMEKYMSAAERVARAALGGPGDLKPTLVRLQPPSAKIEPSVTPLFDYDMASTSSASSSEVSGRPGPNRCRSACGSTAGRSRCSSWIRRAAPRSSSTSRTSRARRGNSARSSRRASTGSPLRSFDCTRGCPWATAARTRRSGRSRGRRSSSRAKGSRPRRSPRRGSASRPRWRRRRPSTRCASGTWRSSGRSTR
ncbi:MAG: hypothetical protein DMF81_10065 [Acidobacteria bacterium]|nr:MAG: hypothetical protein DMF81_10065 [Acidobacteriota bacterium]